jgi:hypothetical protein
VRPDLARALRDDGFRVCIYVPFGPEWFPYFTRRLAERPANLALFLRALTGGGSGSRPGAGSRPRPGADAVTGEGADNATQTGAAAPQEEH